jgi:hypothetical protein
MSFFNPFRGAAKAVTYRSKDGQGYFKFKLVPEGGSITIFCLSHPGFNGFDSDVQRTHLYSSGRICIVKGREPQTMQRALDLAGQWAEYLMRYRETGKSEH